MATITRKNQDTKSAHTALATRMVSSRPKRQREFLVNAEQYLKMADLGFFHERRVELVNGKIIEMAPMNDPHWWGIAKTTKTLNHVFDEYLVLSQVPLALDEYSEPEPDFVVLDSSLLGEQQLSKSNAASVTVVLIEISDSTLAYDRSTKAELYASSDIAEYWIVNLKARQLEVRREPKNGKYAKVETLTEKQSVATLAMPRKKIKVADLLP
jgi:Uma2 family endonuclease